MVENTTQNTDELQTPDSKPPKNSKADQARINGAKSKGPVSKEGKAAVSQNARRYGLGARVLLVDKKFKPDYWDIHVELADSLRPASPAEFMLISDITKIAWKLRQAENMETDLLRENLEHGDSIHSAFTHNATPLIQLSNYQARLSRRMHRLLDERRKIHRENLAILNEERRIQKQIPKKLWPSQAQLEKDREKYGDQFP